MKNITVLGLGAMGSRMAAKLAEANHQVTVWNRTPKQPEALKTLGVNFAETPKDAVRDADFVLSMVRDDAASRQVWLDEDTGALRAMQPEALAIECSTLSVPYVRALTEACQQQNIAFVDAPLAGSRPQAEAGQLIFFVGGSKQNADRVQTVLEPMAGQIHHAGQNTAGTTVKLMVNALFGVQLSTMAELLGFAEKNDLDSAVALDIIGATPVCSPAAKLAATAMNNSAWTPAFPIELVAKDFNLLQSSAHEVAAKVPLGLSAGEVFDAGVTAGIGGDNITGIVQLYRTPTV